MSGPLDPLASWAVLGAVVAVTTAPAVWLAYRLDQRDRRDARRRNQAHRERRPRR